MADAAQLLKPNLYASAGSATGPDAVRLNGGRCASCGTSFFPMQCFGCEHCGSVDLHERSLVACGTLLTWTTVFLHRPAPTAVTRVEAPFTVGTIRLDDGPTIRALLDIVDGSALEPGISVTGRLLPAAGDAADKLELYFGVVN